MKTFDLPGNIKPIWPEIDKNRPEYILRKRGYLEDISHKRTCEEFLDACEKGKADVVNSYIELGINLEFREDISEGTPLTKAVEQNRTDIIRILVEAGADIENRDGSGDTPLMTAINWTNYEAAELLLKLGANPDAADKYNNSCLLKSYEDAGEEYVELLFKHGADPNQFYKLAESVLHRAIDDDNPDRLKTILNNSGSPNLIDYEGLSLLAYAIIADSNDCVETLLKKGADPYQKCNGWSLFDIADFNDNYYVKELIPEIRGVGELEFIYLKSAKSGDTEDIKGIFENSPSLDKDALDYKNRNAVQLAMGEECYETAIFLAEKGVNLRHRDRRGENVIGYCTNYEIVKKLLSMGASPNLIKEGRKICELLSPALDSGNQNFLKILIEHGAVIDDLSHMNLTFSYGDAGPESIAEAVKILGEAGADLEAPDDFESTLLINAADRKSVLVVKALIDAGVNINARDYNNNSALHKAADSYDEHEEASEVVRILLEKGADYSMLNWQENSCYDLLKERDNNSGREILENVMENVLNQADDKTGSENHTEEFFRNLLKEVNYETFLHFVRKNEKDIVEGLLKAGFNPNSPSAKGTQAIKIAVSEGFSEITELLLKEGADPNTLELYGGSTYLEAIRKEDYKALSLLFKNGLNPDQGDDWCRSRVTDAVQNGGLEMVKFLHGKGASMEMFPVGFSPLYSAVTNDDFEICEYLLKNGANIDIRDNSGDTPLISAVNKENTEIVHALLKAGANPDIQNEKGETALILATKKGNRNIIKLLLDGGADSNLKDENGESALSLSSYRDELNDLFRNQGLFIKDEKEHTNVVDKKMTPLLYAVYSQDMEMFERILEDRKTDVNETNYRGDTPLMIAVAFSNMKMIETLLEKGADVGKTNIFKDTAWSYSFVYKSDSIRKKLEQYGSCIDMDALNQWADQSMRRDDIKKSFKEGDIPKIISYLDSKKLDINYLYADQSPLEYAKTLKDFNVFRILMEKGADISLVVARNPEFSDGEL